jgi:hypothetical protein
MNSSRKLAAVAVVLGTLAATSTAHADAFVTLVDDGTIEKNAFTSEFEEKEAEAKLMALYQATGEPIPNVLSVWSTFPLGGSPYGTFFDPIASDVKGIGLETQYGGDGTFTSTRPPLRSILFHNDVTQLATRAALQSAPEADFARYLFLLELTHNWGPALQVPAPNGSELVGFPFHWSFFMDAGGSPAGGNVWHDNGDGTFTTVAASPSKIAYSMLDLYIMGLATPAEVTDFGVLENVVAPASPTDPLWQNAPYAAHSFPWFDTKSSLTVTATRRMLKIADIETTNGMRSPKAGGGPKSYDLGIVLLVSANDSPARIASTSATFAPIAASFAPAFHQATKQRGTLNVVTHEIKTDGTGGGGGGGATSVSSSAAAGGNGGSGGGTSDSSSGCSASSAPSEASPFALALIGAAVQLIATVRRKRGARRARVACSNAKA